MVFGQLAFDHALSVIYAFPDQFPHVPHTYPPQLLVKALLLSNEGYEDERAHGIRTAMKHLSNKSRSFSLASGVFQGRLRIDLILL